MADFLKTLKGQVTSNLDPPLPRNELQDENTPNGYISGYENVSYMDGLIEKTNLGNLDNIKDKGKSLTNYNNLDAKDLPTDIEDNFIKGKPHIDYFWEDPTYLGFEMKFIRESSPLFNYNKDKNDASRNTTLDFLNKYSDIPEIGNRKDIYNEFIINLLKIFNTVDSEDIGKKQYYIESILGLEKMNAKFVEYEKSLIKVTLTEDVGLRMLYIAELYNNLIYSYRTQKYMIPDNCLRFDIEIKVSDYRRFKMENPDFNKDKAWTKTNQPMEINNKNFPYFKYKLFDCNFDFSESNVIQDQITMAGFGDIGRQPAGLDFSIRYKSIERIFKSPLIKSSYEIENKKLKLIHNVDTPYSGLKQPEKSDKGLTKPSTPDALNFKTFVKTGASEILNSAKGTVLDDTEKFVDAGFGELRKARGNMVNKLQEEIRGAVNIPKIYPDNVYALDFGKFSLDNFASGLATDIFNDFDDSLGENLNNVGGF